MSRKDIIVLGMMVFALFLGAGNIIFPPMEGYHAGTSWMTAASGFVLTGVLMPFITLVIVAILGRGEELSRDLPKWAEVLFWCTLYLTIGATFAMPRVINVAYEMAFVPLGFVADNDNSHLMFSIVFCLIGLLCVLRPNTIISTVGEFMTPLLLILLVAVSISVFLSPLSDIPPPSANYADHSALVSGMVGGYQTMDVLAATAFGGIVARALAVKGVISAKKIAKYTIGAGLVSVLLLSALYSSLFYLGATSDAVAQGATNGGQIFSRYVDQLFGTTGVWVMAGIVILANLTTLVGLLNACSDYFAKFNPRLNYRFWVITFAIMTVAISMKGLTTLLQVTIPALLLIYPVAIMLVALQFMRSKMGNIKLTYYSTLIIAVFFGACDSLNQLKLLPETVNNLLNNVPLYSQGIGWLIPCFAMIAVTMSFSAKKSG